MKIVTIGGGTGGSIIDRALAKDYSDLVSVVTSFDNGGSSGILRKEFGTLPHGDIRRRIFAQKTLDNPIFEDLYNYRFPSDEKNENFLERHSLGNLIILAATKIWGEKKGIEKICELFKIRGKVLPITLEQADLVARLEDGQIILGEELIGQTQIDKRKKEKHDDRKIEKVYLTKHVKINPEVEKEILSADYIVLCPGDFYGSLVCNFLVDGFAEVITKSKAKIIFFPNIMTKSSETHNFKLSNFVENLEKYLPKKIDYILYNNQFPSKKLQDKYYKDEQAELVINNLKNSDERVCEFPLLKENGNIRHDQVLILKAFKKILEIDKKKIKRKKMYVFDLDDTLINTTKYNKEFLVKNFKNLKMFPQAEKLLKKIGKASCVLLTYDQHGLQKAKIKSLNLSKYFKKMFIVKTVVGKNEVLKKLKKENPDTEIIVVGDKHDEGELQYACELGMRTVCVAMQGGHHYNQKMHHKYNLVIENQEDFSKVN